MTYRREVDGLRALAVVPVILFHAGCEVFSGGFVGVDVFFVISGYLITSIILVDQQAGIFSIVKFYERRARRILPALFLVILASLPLAWFWLLPPDLKNFSQSLVAVSIYASNILFWLTSGYFETTAELKPLLHTWSLAVEEQYYLLFPVFLIVMWKFGRRWIIACLLTVAVASLCAAQWTVARRPDAAFYLLPTRCWELMIGALVAFHLTKQDRWKPSKRVAEICGAAGLVLLAYSALTFNKGTPFPSIYTLVPTIGTGLIILCSTRETFVGRLLGNSIFVGIGLISYSAYLWHQPLFSFARHASIGEPSRGIFIALTALTMILAYLSWRFVERPFRNPAWINRRQVFTFTAIGSASLIAIGIVGVEGNGFPDRMNRSAVAISKSSEDFSDIRGSLAETVVVGHALNVRGVLIGDSHAEALATALGEALALTGQGVRMLTKVGCPPVTGLYRIDMPNYGRSCDDHHKAAFAKIKADPLIEFAIISARFTLYLESSRFDNGEGGIEVGATDRVIYDGIEFQGKHRALAERQMFIARRIVEDIQGLLAAGKTVLVVYPIPEVGWNVPVIAAKLALKTNSSVNLSTSMAEQEARNRLAWSVLNSLGEHPKLMRVYPHQLLCGTFIPERCAAVVDSKSFYRDTNHLSNTGARILVEKISSSLTQR